MALSHEELDRLIDETRDRGVIGRSIYCGTCGYNLRSLPWVYRCPECGNEYNARPLFTNGIFLAYQCSFPFWRIATAVLFATIAAALGHLAYVGRKINPLFVVIFAMAAVLALFAVFFGWASYCAIVQYRRSRIIAHRIAKEQEDSAPGNGELPIAADTPQTTKPIIAARSPRPPLQSQERAGVFSSELERLADDAFKGRRIGASIYCGNCGYNLKTLPYLYQCPECGLEYNARPLVMKGIFLPLNTLPPFADMAAVAFCGPSAFLLIDGATQPFEPVGFAMGILAAILTVIYFGICVRRWKTMIKTRVILHRINRYEKELAASDND